VGFLHVGRPESGVRRYGQLIATATATAHPDLEVIGADAGRLDDDRSGLQAAAQALAGAQVAIVQWNRRGWHARTVAGPPASLPPQLRRAGGHAA
jgi:hypothetical protein